LGLIVGLRYVQPNLRFGVGWVERSEAQHAKTEFIGFSHFPLATQNRFLYSP